MGMALCLLAQNVSADPLVGQVSLPEESLETSATWASSEASFAWQVNNLGDGTWSYDYRFGTLPGEVSSIVIQTDGSFTDANLISTTAPSWEVGEVDLGFSLLYGISFTNLACTVCTIEFVSDRAPMWGSFGALGTDGVGDGAYAYNASIGDVSNQSVFGAPPFGLILSPGAVAPVPEPETYAMLLAGLLLIGFSRRKKMV